jgi:hypothetical protein
MVLPSGVSSRKDEHDRRCESIGGSIQLPDMLLHRRPVAAGPARHDQRLGLEADPLPAAGGLTLEKSARRASGERDRTGT